MVDRMPVEYVLADKLLEQRKKRRLSQENLARYAGLTARGYREIEEERYVPSIAVLVRLARGLRCTLDELLPLDEIE